MALSYDNIFYDYCLDPLRDLFITEYNYGKIYIAPEILHKDPFSIRIWGKETSTHQYVATGWQKQYDVEIVLYSIESNPGEKYYQQLYRDSERIYQLLFNNKAKETTVNSVSRSWIDGVCEGFEINEYDNDEDEIEGLNLARFNFNCKIMRNN